MLAPEPYLSACLDVIAYAALRSRALGWSNDPDQLTVIANMMDAIHNLPELLRRWETCNEAYLRAALTPALLVVYDEALDRWTKPP
jgi:hypothetical protein